jgi:hypothetical protein
MHPAKAWFLSVVLAAAALVAACMAVNYAADPWGLNDALRLEGVNRYKPFVLLHIRLHKSAEFRRMKPLAIAMGTSRTDTGIRTSSAAWGIRQAYNLAFFGASINETRLDLEKSRALQPLRQVLIGLDFFTFNTYYPDVPDMDDGLDALGGRFATVKYYMTWQMLLDSLRTPFMQHAPASPEAIPAGGHRSAFNETDAIFLNIFFPPPYRAYEFTDGRGRDTLAQFRELVEFARRENVDLRLFISPTHARHLELIRALGLWPKYEYWRSALVRILDEDARRHPGATPFPLWDFADYNQYTTEPVPPAGDVSTSMRWFIESSHYKPVLGEKILARVFGRPDAPADFGVRLDSANLDAQNAAVRARQRAYEQQHTADIAEVEATAARGAHGSVSP